MTLRARWSEAGADHSGPTAARPTKAPMGFPWLDETTGNLYVQTPIGMQVFAVAGLTATAAELNILSGCNATYVELNRASGVTQGTVTAQKNVVVDASKDIADFRNIGYTGAITAKGGAAAAAVVLRFGDTVTEGLEVRVIDEVVSFADAALSKDLTEDIPSGAVVLSAQANVQTAITGGGTSVKVGIGTSGTKNKYGLLTSLAKNTSKSDVIPDWAVLSGAEDVRVYSVASDGTTAGDTNLSVGSVRVRIAYLAPNSLDDAP